ncbi:MAG TPA: Fur family transcriptional regulator [Bryobacteraceae bacterium]|nr:Fur family transcriptional regulator [Bryobacteraceae bacterium]
MSNLHSTRKTEEALQAAGLRCTPQRIAVLDYLVRHPDHGTVDELWPALNKRHVQASRATVYNTLHSLVKAGLVREFKLDGAAARYDACLQPHHHFICDRCGMVEDLEWFEVPALEGKRRGLRSIRSYEVVVRGVCPKCH